MERESFVFYKSFYDAIKELDLETQAVLYDAICRKALYDEEKELNGTAKIMYTLIKPQLDANNKRYLDGLKGKEFGKLGGRPKKEKEEKTPGGFLIKTPNVNDNENVNENENDIYTLSEAQASSSGAAKASKHKHGEFKHVLLKDEELQALKRDYANWEELIKYLDEYIEMKGYKAKSHYLAIKKWVVNAVKENQQKTQSINSARNLYKPENSQYSNLSRFYANWKECYKW